MKKRTKMMTSAGATAVVGALALAVSPIVNAATPGTGSADGESRIIGGQTAEAGQFPWLVGVVDSAAPEQHHCVGSLLTEDLVLTAAQCAGGGQAKPSDVTVRHGSLKWNGDDMVNAKVEALHIADEYGEPTELSNDWALIKLAKPIAGAKTLPLAETPDYDKGDFEVAGWGLNENQEHPDRLHWAKVPFVDDEKCANAYENTDLAELWNAESMICSGFLNENNTGVCKNDGGGPLVGRDAEGEPVQVGVISWGKDGCASKDYPAVATQSSFVAKDILAAAEKLTG